MSQILTEQCNFIAIGAWNPAIIQPIWLRNQFPDYIPNERIPIQVVAGAISSFRMEFEKFILDPNGGKLIFIPKVLDEQTLDLIAKLSQGIKKRLEHTPITAAGCNFAFILEKDEVFSFDEIEEEDKIKELYPSLEKEYGLVSRGVKHTFSLEDHTINFNCEYKGTERIVRINFDYQLPVNPMKKAAESLVKNYKKSLNLIGDLIRKEK